MFVIKATCKVVFLHIFLTVMS